MSVYIHRGLNMVYERMKEASHIVGIDLLDYLIATYKSEYRSLREIGDLERRTILNKWGSVRGTVRISLRKTGDFLYRREFIKK